MNSTHTHVSTTDDSVAYIVSRNFVVVVFRMSEDGPEYTLPTVSFDARYEPVNAHEAEVDARIAQANEAYAKATQNAAWWHKHFRTQHDGAAKAAEAHKAMDEALLALDTVNAEFQGWSRFFLVNASNGHIHRSMHCSTCFPTTSFSWLPALSGMTEAHAVAEYGGILCSHCFPSAPVEWTTGVNKKDAARKAAEAALKAIAKTPEGKAVVRKRELVRSHQYTLDRLDHIIGRPVLTERYSYAEDRNVPLTVEDIAEQQKRIDDARVEREAVAKKMNKAHAQMLDAEHALNKAMGLCGQGHEVDDEGLCNCDV